MLRTIPQAVLLTLFAVCTTVAADDLVVAGPGHSTVIIRGDQWKPSAWYDWGGHAILERFLGLVTGVDVSVVAHSQLTEKNRGQYQTRIWIGRQPEVERVLGETLDRLDDDGFIIRAVGGDVYVAGKYWWGDNWAAYDLLERVAGCRWYGPEPAFWKPKEEGMVGLFDVIQRRPKITIPADFSVVEEPSYRMRWFRFMPMHSFRLRYRDHFHHALVGIIPPAQYGKTHPEYFPLIDGQRRVPPTGAEHQFQPCVANPEVVELVAGAAIDFFRKNPQAGSFSVGMNDTDRFCECDRCLAIAPKELHDKQQRLAYAFFDFYNRTARRVEKDFPAKRLGCLAYAGLSGLPAGSIRLHPMLVPYLTRDSAQLFDPDEVREFRETVDRWRALSERMGIYEYIYGGGFVVPRIYNRYLIRNVQDRYGAGVDGFYAESYPNWGLDGPKYWLLARMLWNHRQDPGKLLDEYYRDLFGPAAKTMRGYFDYLEDAWCTQTLDSDRSNYRWMLDPRQLEIFPPDKCARAWAMLETAGKQTSDPVVLRRIAYSRDSFALTRALSGRYAAVARLDELMKEKPADDLKTWLTPRLAALDAWLEIPNPRAANLDRVPAGALDLNVTPDISRYDRQPVEGVAEMVEQIVVNATERQTDLSQSAVQRRIDETISADADRRGASELLKTLAVQRGVLYVRHSAKSPEIDGQIAAGEWPDATLSGRFYRVHGLDEHAESTAVYATWNDGRLHLGFDCRQNPTMIAASVVGVDRGGWREPAMLRDDCINLTFRRNVGGFRSIRINAAGALGFDATTWDGVMRSAARKTPSGWQAELALAMDKIGLKPEETNWTLAIARYGRRAGSKPEEPAEVFTMLPAPHGRGVIGYGNHPTLMTFVTGPRLVFEKETRSVSED